MARVACRAPGQHRLGAWLAASVLVIPHNTAGAAVTGVGGGLGLLALSLAGRPPGGRHGGGWAALIRPDRRHDGPASEPEGSKTDGGVSMDRRLTKSHRGSGRRVVVITGATAGIGRATARAFAAHGDDVALLARGQDRLDATKRELEAAGVRAVAISVDVADAAAVERAADHIEAAIGPIEVWVNNAMASVFSRAIEMSADEYRRVTEVTYLGYVHGTLAALRRMVPRDRGVIIQVGSALAYRSIPLQSAYCAAKSAIVGFTDSVRSELIHDDSRVSLRVVHLPAVNTPQFEWVRSRLPRMAQPVPPIYQPEVAAEAIAWLADHDKREMNLGAPTYLATLGQKFVPGLLDRYLATAAWDGQMTSEPRSLDAPDNLLEPLPGDRGAHGAFDERARDVAPSFWLLERNRPLVAGIATALGIAAAGAWAMSSQRRVRGLASLRERLPE